MLLNRRARILHVEDDDLLQRAFRRMFKDHHVETASSYDEALLALGLDVPFDIIVSDYNINGSKTGEDLLDWIREMRPELVDKFIFVSDDDRTKVIHNHVFQKPVDVHVLVSTINAML